MQMASKGRRLSMVYAKQLFFLIRKLIKKRSCSYRLLPYINIPSMFPSSYTALCLLPPSPSVIYLSTLFGTMDKVKLVKNGVMRLPPGFRFHPTDEELVVQYLKRKVLSSPLPASIIPDFDVCRADPWDLPGWFLFLLFCTI